MKKTAILLLVAPLLPAFYFFPVCLRKKLRGFNYALRCRSTWVALSYCRPCL